MDLTGIEASTESVREPRSYRSECVSGVHAIFPNRNTPDEWGIRWGHNIQPNYQRSGSIHWKTANIPFYWIGICYTQLT